MEENTYKIDCSDIYKEEINKSIKALKRFREAWMGSLSTWNEELFQYADDDFYFYRFAIGRQEASSGNLLTSILYRVMDRYETPVKEPGDAPFNFIIGKTGYRFEDFNSGENVNSILDENKLDNAVVLRTWKTGKADEWISRENCQYQNKGIKLKAISIQEFYKDQFGEKECKSFLSAIDEYLHEAREITGYHSIKFLSSMNLASRKLFEEKMLAEWDYKNYKYQILDPNNKQIQKFLPSLHSGFDTNALEVMEKAYLKDKLYRTMVGSNEYAESFITSEWLYYSLKGQKNFDYTSVISGYLKSIEQLLYQIVMININNYCKISMKSKLLKKAYKNSIPVYEQGNKKTWVPLPKNSKGNGYVNTKFPYVDFTLLQKEYMDSSIGTFEYFIRNNSHIISSPCNSETIADMISCFRTECRNGFFHTHNLNDWNIVEKTRDNAIYLYFVLLGSCIIPENKKSELGLLVYDEFDELCRKIREFKHFNVNFIFEYEDGRRQKMIFDFFNNTVVYTDNGIEHYESLLFYKVDNFEGALEQLEEGIREEQIFHLTRENLPRKIFGVHRKIRNQELEELTF